MQDCADVLAGKGFYSPYGPKTKAVNTDELAYYVSGAQDAWLDAHKAETWGNAIVTAPIPVSEMHAWRAEHPGSFIAAIAPDAL